MGEDFVTVRALELPADIVREALYPVVGEKTLRELVREAKANDQVFQARVRTVLRSSYSNHYRRMLPALLAALDFRGTCRVAASSCWSWSSSSSRSAARRFDIAPTGPAALLAVPIGGHGYVKVRDINRADAKRFTELVTQVIPGAARGHRLPIPIGAEPGKLYTVVCQRISEWMSHKTVSFD